MTVWSPQQNEALSTAGAWLRIRHQPTFYLAGFAGAGKSTLAMHLASYAKGDVAFAAFTGKAARVMRSKGCRGAKTIHALIYNTEVNESTGEVRVTLKDPGALDKYGLIVIDECSMVNEEMGKDLLSFGRPVLVLGDPAQLPPVSGGGYFTARKPDYMLTEVHRQAAESPILWLATEIREGRYNGHEMNTDGLIVTSRKNLDGQLVTEADVVIVGRNDTRQQYNRRLREIAGKTDPFPLTGEPLICLRNDRFAKIFNGDILTVGKRRSARSPSSSGWMTRKANAQPRRLAFGRSSSRTMWLLPSFRSKRFEARSSSPSATPSLATRVRAASGTRFASSTKATPSARIEIAGYIQPPQGRQST